MYYRIRVLSTGLKGREFEVEDDGFSVGRTPEHAVVLDQPSVSRSHARVWSDEGGVRIEDLGSRNRTKVDGRVLTRPEALGSGSTVQVGDVLLLVEYASSAEALAERERKEQAERAPTDEEETPAAGTLARRGAGGGTGAPMRPARGIPAAWLAPQVAAAQPEGETSKPGRLARWKGWAALAGALAAAVVIAAYFSRQSGDAGPVRRLGQVVQVGQKRVTEVPIGYIYHPQITDEGIVRVYRERGMTLFVIVEGVSEGLATVRLRNRDGSRYVLLHVKVVPSAIEGAAELQEWELTPEQRLEQATKWVEQATALRRTSVYEAMRLYGDAVSLLRTIEPRPPLYNLAINGYYMAKDDLDAKYDELVFEMKNLINSGDQRAALEKLEKIKELIPDGTDWRRQDAELRYRLLQDIIRRRERMERKTL
jgi:pSer/pThr/pTyr-binding forkhead associated (FHA) protein